MRNFSSFSAAYPALLSEVLNDGAESAPRGRLSIELLNVGFSIGNPRSRWFRNAARKASLRAAVGEFAWHMAGSRDLHFIEAYLPAWKAFSEDKKIIYASSYGYTIHKYDQLENVINVLRDDSSSRRAVIYFKDVAAKHSSHELDVPCAISAQYFIRDGKVESSVVFRSNDLYMGLPYDVFFFTMLHEYISLRLGVELGAYHHFMGSAHIYENHVGLAKEVIGENFSEYEFPPMAYPEALTLFLGAEHTWRTKSKIIPLPEYWSFLLDILAKRNLKKLAA